jgi:hypothetical protein
METIDQKFQKLPLNLQQEALDFIDFLFAKKAAVKHKKPRLSWFGGLKEFRDQFTALELQKKASSWRD